SSPGSGSCTARRCAAGYCVTPSDFVPGWLAFKAIADTTHGHNTSGVGRVWLDLLSQPAHVHVYRAAAAIVRPAPHPLEDEITGEGDAPVARQEEQQLVLLRLELRRLAVEPHLAPRLVDDQIAEDQRLVCLNRSGYGWLLFSGNLLADQAHAPQKRLHPRH